MILPVYVSAFCCCFFFQLQYVMKISSYNCQSSKRNIGGIRQLCDRSDIVFLQEHWLPPDDLPTLNNIHFDFVSFGLSSMNMSDGLIVGRPYGGVAVLFKRSLMSVVKPVVYDNSRMLGLECSVGNVKFLLLNTYLPCNSPDNFDSFIFYLGMIQAIIDDFDSPYVCVLGDFNSDIVKQTTFGKELKSFCDENQLVIADSLFLPEDSVTHVNDGHDTESWLDHFIFTQGFYALIREITIDYSIICSDHFPLSALLRLADSFSVSYSSAISDDSRWVVDWSSVDQAGKDNYLNQVEDRLNAIEVPFGALNCQNTMCTEHSESINSYYNDLMICLNDGARYSVSKKVSARSKKVPGWTEYVQSAHDTLGDIYCLWAAVGKPRDGYIYIYTQLRLAKSRFKFALRWCVRNENQLRAKSLAEKLRSNPQNSASFWKDVKKLSSSPPLASTVGGVTGPENIGQMWKNHFSAILNAVSDDRLEASVLDQLGETSDNVHNISVHEVKDAIRDLSSSRSGGHDGLQAEHFKFAEQACAVHLSLCFSMMLKHGHLPPDLVKVVLVPIVKDKTGNLSDQDNYRPIAKASVSSKILESIILNRCKRHLFTSDHQFGFKARHSTDMAIYAVKEISDYYLRNNSPVFICFMDSKKN